MIILLSPNQLILETGRAHAARYGEGVAYFKPGCLDGCQDARLTIGGHGSMNQYGEHHLSPEAFVKKCEEYNLLHSVKTIDLLSCETDQTIEQQINYAKNVAKILHDKGYDIQVNTFSAESEQHKANVVTKTTVENKNPTVDSDLLDKIKKIKQSTAQTVIHLTKGLLEAKFEGDITHSDDAQPFNKMLSKFVDLEENKLSPIQHDDIRAIFDNKGHQCKPNDFLRAMPPGVQSVIRTVNQRIAELSDAKWTNFVDHSTQKELMNLRIIILSNPTVNETENHLLNALKDSKLAHGKTHDILQNALKQLKAPKEEVKDDHSRAFKNT